MQGLKIEITDICTELISIINEHLILSTANPAATVFYNKMKGDYNKYLAEVESGEKRVEVSNEALKAYEYDAAGMIEDEEIVEQS
ncbi:hypothetical protein ACS0TY_004550 [Phlomoides rotata]